MSDFLIGAVILLIFAAGIVIYEVRASRKDRKTAGLRATSKPLPRDGKGEGHG